ncbi:MAG: hypothetical protein ACP5N6_07535 [Anaerolineae bacterium]
MKKKDNKSWVWLILLALALVALGLTLIPLPTPEEPTAAASPAAERTAILLASPTLAETEPTRNPTLTPTRTCVEPEPAKGTPAGGIFTIEAAPCTRELALRDFAEIYRFWSNIGGNPFEREVGFDRKDDFFVRGQPAWEMWRFNTEWYATNKSAYVVWDTRGYEPERVEAIFQDPAGMTVWIFYRRDVVTAELRRLDDDDSVVETYQDNQGLMRWVLTWQEGKYKAVSYESKVSLP